MALLKIRRTARTVHTSCAAGAMAAVALANAASAQNVTLQQIRNGPANSPTTPVVQWVSGNANATQAHYLEGHSVAYRILITGLTPGDHWIEVQWDTRANGKHALDMLTHFDRLHPHDPFPHPEEDLNPLDGASGTYGPPSTFPIPAPAPGGIAPNPNEPTLTFNALPPDERAFTIYNGTITNMEYVSQGSLAGAAASSRMRIYFTNTASNVVMAFGGRIASQQTWGAGNSASGINGSPYHMQMGNASFGNLGSQSRSLMAGAILVPPTCGIDGLDIVCPGSTNPYSGPSAPQGQTFTYAWTLVSDCGATFTNGTTNATGQIVDVIACSTCGEYTLNLHVTSSNMLFNDCSLTVAVVDTEAPQITQCLPAASAQCGANFPAATTVAEFIAMGGAVTDNCALPAQMTISHVDGAPNGTCPATITRTYTITDACGNSATCEQSLTVNDTVAPVITACIPNLTVECFNDLPAPAATIQAFLSAGGNVSDNCTPQLQLTISHVDGPPQGLCPMTIVRTYTIRDACNNFATCQQTITVSDTQAPVIASCLPPASIQCVSQLPPAATSVMQFLALGGVVSDNCSLPPQMTISHSDSAPSGSCPTTIVRTYTIRDFCNNPATCQQTITINDTTAPVITACLPGASVQCFNDLPLPVTTIAAFLSGGGAVTDNCTPQNQLTISHSDSAPQGICPMTIVRTYTIRDACNNPATCQQTITVSDTQAPVITQCLANVNINCGDSLPPAATTVLQFLAQGGAVTDNCSNPAQMTITHEDSGPSGSCPSTVTRTYTIRDFCNNPATCTQQFFVDDKVPPVLKGCPEDIIAQCLETLPPPADVTATDNCGQATVTMTQTDVGSGCAKDPRIVTRTWTARDLCNNTATCTQIIRIEDTIPPTMSCPPDVDVDCSAGGQSSVPPVISSVAELIAQGGSASDNCSDVIIYLVDETQSPAGECPIIITRTYRAIDACDNKSEPCTQIIRVVDNTPPVVCCVLDYEGCVGFPVKLQVPQVTDECGMTITPLCERSDGMSCSDPFPLGVTFVTWTATDGCGNKSAPLVATVTMRDCPTYRSKTQSGWSNGGSNDGGSLVHTLLSAPYGNLVVGQKNMDPVRRSLTIRADAAHCVAARLPAGGTPAALPQNFGDKTLRADTCNSNNPVLPLTNAGKFKNKLLGQSIALGLSLRYDQHVMNGQLGSLQLCPVMTTINQSGQVKTYTIPSSVLTALGNNRSVNNLRNLANKALAGRSVIPTTLSAINTALNTVNTMFSDNGPVALLSTSCTGLAMTGGPAEQIAAAAAETNNFNALASGSRNNASGSAGDHDSNSANNGAYLNSGTLAPAATSGIMEIDRDFVQSPKGTLLIQIRGSEPVAGYDVLEVEGTAHLNGSIIVSLADGFLPTLGEQYDIVIAENVIGQFSNVVLPVATDGIRLELAYTATGVSITVTSAAVEGDLDNNGVVDVLDLRALLRYWGGSDTTADLNRDGTVDTHDLSILLARWGVR